MSLNFPTSLRNTQQLRLESLQTAIEQHNDLFRHFWDIDKVVVALATRLVELRGIPLCQDRCRL